MYLYNELDLYDEQRIQVQDVLTELIESRIRLNKEDPVDSWSLLDELGWLKKVFEGTEAY